MASSCSSSAGAQGVGARETEVSLAAGAHAIELYAVRRRAVAAETALSVVDGPGLQLGQRACLLPGDDDDRDGILDVDDVAPVAPLAPNLR